MLDELRVTNYKSFSEPTVIPLRPVTILIGKNNSGKTAATRLPLLLNAAIDPRRKRQGGPLPLAVGNVRFGSSLNDLIHGQNPHGQISLGLSVSDVLGRPSDLDVDVQLRQSLSTNQLGFVSRYHLGQTLRLDWDRKSRPTGSQSSVLDVDFNGLHPILGVGVSPETHEELARLQEELAGITHISSLRRTLSPIYENREPDESNFSDGSETPYLMMANESLLDQVNEWYRDNLSTRITIEAEASSFQLKAGTRNPQNLAQSGQGLQQVLPIVASFKMAATNSGASTILAIEEPEVHLHPSAQAGIADLAADAVNQQPYFQTIIETHSENLILRLRRHIASGRLDPDKVNILWFDRANEQSRVREILIDRNGAVNYWPDGVFSEDLNEIRAIVRSAKS
jgi:hypothetical protein